MCAPDAVSFDSYIIRIPTHGEVIKIDVWGFYAMQTDSHTQYLNGNANCEWIQNIIIFFCDKIQIIKWNKQLMWMKREEIFFIVVFFYENEKNYIENRRAISGAIALNHFLNSIFNIIRYNVSWTLYLCMEHGIDAESVRALQANQRKMKKKNREKILYKVAESDYVCRLQP